jgi:uncharacterized protein YciI
MPNPSASRLFVVRRGPGPAWRAGRPMDRQPGWAAHAAFMNALAAAGIVLLGGPLTGTSDVLLIARAPSAAALRARLARDPWARAGLLRIVEIRRWTLRLGALEAPLRPSRRGPGSPSR